MTRLLLAALVAWGLLGGPSPVQASRGVVAAAPTTKKPRKRTSTARPRPPKKVANPAEVEVNLNDDRKRAFKRLRVLNKELRDGVLAATVGKLERKETIRHELTLLAMTLEDRRAEAEGKGDGK